MRHIKVGLCGFTVGMAQYPRYFPVVEIQQTFYQPPEDKTLRCWRANAPPDFEFTLKGWQLITHTSTSSTYMVFRVKDEALLDKVKTGDKVKFRAEGNNGALTLIEIEVAK